MTAASREIASKPYKGAESYQAEDGELFFGREREAEQLVAMVVSRRLSLLHAPSGAGKTSLLNARLIPELERRGFLPVRVLPQNHPLESIRISLLEYLLPPLEAEALAVRQAIAEPALAAGDGDRPESGVTLRQLRERRERLPVHRYAKRALIAPIDGCAAPPSLTFGEFGAVVPWFRRWLRGSVDVAVLEGHLRMISDRAATRHLGACPLDEDFPAERLLALVTDPELVADYDALFESLYLPLPGLHPFLDNLYLGYGRLGDSNGLVIILDQFEELFTRFVGLEPGVRGDQRSDLDRPGWGRRIELFRELAGLRRREQEAERLATSLPGWPVRILISMRNEYIANLDELTLEDRDFALEERYHLQFLDRSSAAAAICEPALRFGYTYSQACYDGIIEELIQEDRRVQPAHVQIVCEKLWEESGRSLARHRTAAGAEDGELPEIPYQTYLDKLRGTEGILQSYLDDFLARLDRRFLTFQGRARAAGETWLEDLSCDDVRLEVLELLEPLKTSDGTRNIVARSELLSQPFRRSDLRSWLLDELNDHRIVRVEKRLSGLFVEITHEFLIRPIQERLLREIERDPSLALYREALARLRYSIDEDVRSADHSPLTTRDLDHLVAHAARLDLDYLGAERVLRFAILEGQNGGALGRWAERVRRTADPDLRTILRRRRPLVLSRDELDLVDANRGELRLDRGQLELILKSALLRLDPASRHEDVTYWTRRLRDHGTQP